LYEIKKLYPNILIIKKEHSGTALTRLKGLDFVDTLYFSFADSDDAVRSKGLIYLVNKMYYLQCDVGICRFQFHMSNFSLPSRKKWDCSVHSFQNSNDLGHVLNIFPNKIFSSDLIPVLKSIPVTVPVYEDTIPVFFLCALSKQTYITDRLLYDYYHSDITSSFSYQANPVYNIGVGSLYQLYLDGLQYGLERELFPKHQNAYDSMFIRLFLQRIKAMFHNKTFTKEEKDILAKDLLDILYAFIPNWREHPNYQSMFSHCEFNDIYNSIAAYLHLRDKKYFIDYESSSLSSKESFQNYCMHLDYIRKKNL